MCGYNVTPSPPITLARGMGKPAFISYFWFSRFSPRAQRLSHWVSWYCVCMLHSANCSVGALAASVVRSPAMCCRLVLADQRLWL